MKLAKRFRWRRYGGLIEVRVYQDGSSHIRVDHPSNDPGVELAITGLVLSLLRERYLEDGLELKLGPIHWRDDPPATSPAMTPPTSRSASARDQEKP